LFEVGPGLNGKNTSVHLLVKEVLGPPRSLSILEKGKGPEDFFLIVAELFWGQAQIKHTRIEEGSTRILFTREVWGREEFWPCLLFRQSGRDRGRRADRRERYGYQRRSNS